MSGQTSEQLSAAAVAAYRAGRLDEAEAIYRQLAARKVGPNDALPMASAHYNLGFLLGSRGRLEEAVPHYRRAAELRPGHGPSHNNLGAALQALGRPAEAEKSCRRAVALQPDNPNAHYNLGNALKAQRRYEDALGAYERALSLKPDDADIWHNSAIALHELGRASEAETRYHRTLALDPKNAEACYNLGVALDDQGRTEAAAQSYWRALRLDPKHAKARNNLGQILADKGAFEEALALFDEAAALKADYADPRWNAALVHLVRGEFERGWPGYEQRLDLEAFGPPRFDIPAWTGEPLAGRTLLLHAEQGFGDTLQFVRYAPLVKALGARVVLECQAELARLLQSAAGVDRLVVRGEPLPPFDRHAALPSLPGLLGTDLGSIPAAVPYLHADPALAEAWRARVSEESGPNVGLVWRGNAKHAKDARRSIPAGAMAALLNTPGVRWFSLQAGAPGEEEKAAILGSQAVTDWGPLLTDWAETAAAVTNLDLVVTVDTAVAHLAGALGKPVFILLSKVGDWRWLLGRTDSPWYPTARLYRQAEAGDWSGVLDAVKRELALFAGGKRA